MPPALGFNPIVATAAKAELRTRRHAVVKAAPPKAPAKSLMHYQRRKLEQKSAGTCWLHAPTAHAEIAMRRAGIDGFDVCRRLVGYEGVKYQGGGNPTDGGSGGNAYRALAEIGAAHESLLPYSDSRRDLGTKPPSAVYADAKAVHFTTPIDVRSFDDAITLIDQADTPTSVGWWWTDAWDSSNTFMTRIGRGVGYHEILIVGYAKPGTIDGNEWIQFLNWHGDLYPVLKPEQAAKVPGYKTIKPDMTDNFWVERSLAEKVYGFGNSDMNSADRLDGLPEHLDVSNDSGMFF